MVQQVSKVWMGTTAKDGPKKQKNATKSKKFEFLYLEL